MIAKNNEVITSAVSTIYEITQDQKLVEYIRYRDEEIAEKNRIQDDAIKAKAETAEAKKEAAEMKREITKTKKQLAKSEQRIAELEEALRQALEKRT